MTTTHTTSTVLSLPKQGLLTLVIVFFCLLLLSCSSSAKKDKNVIPESQQYAEAAQKARESGPLDGDVSVINGVEYVYGRNTRYMTTPTEPLYVWAPRYLYSPSYIDTIPGRVGSPTKGTKETAELEERLARLEQAVRGGSAPQTARPEESVTDATGRKWTLYFSNDDGVRWYLDEAALQPSRSIVQMWRKRVFPRWALQKEIVTLDELSCRENRYRTRELRVTRWDGTSQTSDKVTPWANVYSSSPEQYLIQGYCK
jgi:hypothetical protein